MWQLSPLSETGNVADRLTHVHLKHTSVNDGEIGTQIELEQSVSCYFPSVVFIMIDCENPSFKAHWRQRLF